MSEMCEKVQQLVINADAGTLETVIKLALDAGTAATDILNNGLLPAMNEVGQKMKTGEMFIPEVLMSAKAMQAGLELLSAHMGAGEEINAGTCVIGTVEGDLHDIGKNLVGMMLSGSGFKVIDLGVNVKSQDFISATKEHGASLIGMSTLLTTTMPKMAETIQCLSDAGLRDRVKVLIGGAPVTQQFATKIGADGYGYNAPDAVQKAKELVKIVKDMVEN